MSYKTSFKGDTLAVELWLLDLEEFDEPPELVPRERAETIMFHCLQGPDGVPCDRMPNKEQQAELKKLGFPTDLLRSVKYCVASESSVGLFDDKLKLKGAIDRFIEWSKEKRKATKKVSVAGFSVQSGPDSNTTNWTSSSANVNTGNIGAGSSVSWETTTMDGVTRTVKRETVNGITATTVFTTTTGKRTGSFSNIAGNNNTIDLKQDFSGINLEDRGSTVADKMEEEDSDELEGDMIQIHRVTRGGQGNIGSNNRIGVMQTFSGINTGGGSFNAIASQTTTTTKNPWW